MHLTIVTTSYPADADDGAGGFVRAEALAARDAGAEVHVVCPGASAAADPEIHIHAMGGAEAFGWPGAAERLRRSPWRLPSAALFVARARREVRRLAPDRIQAHWMVPCGWPIAASIADAEVVAHGGDVRLLLAAPRALRERVVQRMLSAGARVRFVAEQLRSRLAPSLSPALREALLRESFVEPCALMPLGPRRPRSLVRRELAIESGRPTAVVVGRLVASKGTEEALEAAHGAGLATMVVGDGPRRRSLEARFPSARWLGHLPRSRALDAIAAADLLIDASREEGAPTVVREARALSVPVLSCGAGDVRRWAEDDAGIAVCGREALGRRLRLASARAGVPAVEGAGRIDPAGAN